MMDVSAREVGLADPDLGALHVIRRGVGELDLDPCIAIRGEDVAPCRSRYAQAFFDAAHAFDF